MSTKRINISAFLDDEESATTLPNTPIVLGPCVPNVQPTLNCFPYRIAIIGEAPGKDEEVALTPFVGYSGQLLDDRLSRASIVRSACFIGNICQYRPPRDDISQFSREGNEIKEGLERLSIDIATYDPNIILLLGGTALFFAKGVENITDWRGSVFISDRPGPFLGRKCIAAIHPAACLRQYKWTPLLLLDIVKCKRQAESKELHVPDRHFKINLSLDELLAELDRILTEKPLISPDIEGGIGNMTCCSLATSWNYSVLVPFSNMDGTSYWPSLEEEWLVWNRFSRILADPEIPKVWQNGLYDRFVLQYGYGLFSACNYDDTMLKFWEQYCELEKSLAFQCSVLLDYETYYKAERKATDREVHFTYCCKDSANTYAINTRLEKILTEDQKAHYQNNIAMLNPLLFMELNGIRYNEKEAKNRLEEINQHVYNLQADLDAVAGVGFAVQGLHSNQDKGKLLAQVQEIMCHKREPNHPKKDYEKDYPKAKALLMLPSLTREQIGWLNIVCGISMNTKSPAYKRLLYETLKLPPQYVRDLKGKQHQSTNYESLLKIQKAKPHQAVTLGIEIGLLRTRSQMLEIHADRDGRIRCGYNCVGTETGRLSCYTSPTGSGYNLQTIPDVNNIRPLTDPLHRGMRDLFLANEGYYIFQCDLKGSDGWTIGAYLKMLGDPTMFDDLSFGLKPAAVVCYMLRHGNQSLHGRSRAEIAELLKEVKKEDWDYFACKQGIWGACYTMGPDKMASVIAIQSEGKIWMSRSAVVNFQSAVFSRYHIRTLHSWMQLLLNKKKELVAPNGFKRRFFGRKNEILGQALAHMPQVITTYATNTAMLRLWTDQDNRDSQGHLRIQPLHQVHDALIGQFRIEDTTWAVERIKSYFDNPITLAGTTFTIPFEGAYGTNWALDENSKKGTI